VLVVADTAVVPAPTFEDFYRAAYPRVVRSLALAIGDVDAAADAAQEAFGRAYRRWFVVRRADRPEAWVYVVALRHHRRVWRRRRRDGDVEASPLAGGGSSARLDNVDRTVDLERSLGQLTERQRAMVVLRFHADLPVRDVAEVMGCAEGTVKATLHQALKALRVEFSEEDLT
jgi:RNA polymerase sigma-70 factor (sigma-E family)